MNKKAFTLVELVVVITILAILASISVISYGTYISDARDASRIADVGLAKSDLRSHAQKQGAYPVPASSFSIVYSGSLVATQGLMDDTVGILGSSHIPKDPKLDRYYGYSVTKNRQTYELGLTLENQNTPIAYVDGDYQTVAKNILPSLFIAADNTGASEVEIGDGKTWSGSVGSDNRKKFILSGDDANLLYNMKGAIVAWGLSVDGFGMFIFPSSASVPTNTNYTSCDEISDAGYGIGAGEYQIRSEDGKTVSSTICTGTGFSL